MYKPSHQFCIQVSKPDIYTNLSKERYAKYSDMHVVIMQAGIVVVRAMRQAGLAATSHTRRSIPEENHRPRQAGPMLSQPAFDWNQ